jgi:hypothetical protein
MFMTSDQTSCRNVILTVNFKQTLILFLSFNILQITLGPLITALYMARMGEDRGVYRVLVGKPGGKRPLERPRRRWEDNIKMDLQEVGGGRGNWMELAQNRDRSRELVGTVRNFRVP